MTSSPPDPAVATVLAYDRGAEAYAISSRQRSHLSRLHARFRRALPAGSLVLDLGCGPAYDGAELAALGLRVLGLDPSRGMLLQGSRQRSMRGLLLLADARALPIADGRLDGVWACASLLHVPRRDVTTAVSEVCRVLRRGGILFTSMSRGEGDPLVKSPPLSDSERQYYFYQPDEWHALMRGAGLSVLDGRVTLSHPNPGSTGWIETLARKP